MSHVDCFTAGTEKKQECKHDVILHSFSHEPKTTSGIDARFQSMYARKGSGCLRVNSHQRRLVRSDRTPQTLLRLPEKSGSFGNL